MVFGRHFYKNTTNMGNLNPILGKLRVTHDLCWWVVWKPMVNIQFALIFSLSITVLQLWGKNVYSSAFFPGGDLFALIFTCTGSSPSTFLASKNYTLGYPKVKTASFCVPSFWHNTGVGRTDRRICRSIYSACKAIQLALRRTVKTCLLYTSPSPRD